VKNSRILHIYDKKYSLDWQKTIFPDKTTYIDMNRNKISWQRNSLDWQNNFLANITYAQLGEIVRNISVQMVNDFCSSKPSYFFEFLDF